MEWQLLYIKTQFKGFPGGPVVKNLPCNAKDASSIPGAGRSHMLRGHMHHNCWPCAREPVSGNYWSPPALEPVLCYKRSPCNETPVHHKEKAAPAGHSQSNPVHSNETQYSHK